MLYSKSVIILVSEAPDQKDVESFTTWSSL